jgi:hypothetical protein
MRVTRIRVTRRRYSGLLADHSQMLGLSQNAAMLRYKSHFVRACLPVVIESPWSQLISDCQRF